jgi:hypothetical protein
MALALAAAGLCAFFAVAQFPAINQLLSITFWIATGTLIWQDCSRTKMNRAGWSLLGYFTGVFGLWIYLLVRNSRGLRG